MDQPLKTGALSPTDARAEPARDNPPMHVLIPFAACSADACQQALQTLPLPNLAALLQRLTPTTLDAGDDFALSMPHERALARELGLPADNGLTPWAARDMLKNGDKPGRPGADAWAFITPCHWRLATDHFLMDEPDLLQIDDQESKALLAAMAPFFAEDGITLQYTSPTQWRAQGEVFRGLPTASLDRVRGRSLDIWMPDGPQAKPLRRLQSEMQMLLYTHPVNDAREARGLAPVNAFWVSGTGVLPPEVRNGLFPAELHMPTHLTTPALRADWPAWAKAWQQLDATACADLLAHLQQHGQGTLTLCGERSAQRFEARPRSLGSKISSLFGRLRPSTVLEKL